MNPQASDPERWVDLHGDALFRFALSRLGDASLAEDLVQETFLAAITARDGFRGEAAERTWLVGILRHKLIDLLRRRCREQPLPAEVEGDAVVDGLFAADGHWRKPPCTWAGVPEDLAGRREFWRVFDSCRGELPERQAAVFILRMVDAVDPETICQDLGITATNLWVLLHRARIRLRACLEANWFGGSQP